MMAKQEMQIQQLFKLFRASGNGDVAAAKMDISHDEIPSTSTAMVPLVSSSEVPLKRRKVDEMKILTEELFQENKKVLIKKAQTLTDILFLIKVNCVEDQINYVLRFYMNVVNQF